MDDVVIEMGDVAEKLERLQNFTWKPPFEEIGQYLVAETHLRFLNGESPNGKKWLPSQRVKKEGGQTLLLRGHLRDSITYKLSDESTLQVGSNLQYAAIHQFGGKAGRNHKSEIPARPYVGVNETDLNEIHQIIIKHITSLLQ